MLKNEGLCHLTKCPFGTVQYSWIVNDDLQVHITDLGSPGEFEAGSVFTSECYAGNMVANSTAWNHEIPVAMAIATARLMLWDYELSLSVL